MIFGIWHNGDSGKAGGGGGGEDLESFSKQEHKIVVPIPALLYNAGYPSRR